MFGAEDLPQPPAPNDKKGTATGFAAMYDNAGIFAALAIDNAKFGNAATGDLGAPAGNPGAVDDEANALKLGGGYSTDAFTVNAAIDTITNKNALAATETKNTNLYLGAKFNISSTDAVKVAFTNLGETKNGGVGVADGITQVAFGYDHGMSKNTSVYALYTKISADTAGAAEPSVISFGLKHAF